MHSLCATASSHPANAFRSQSNAQTRASELDVRSQLDYASTIEGIPAEPKPGVLKGVVAIIRTSIRRRCPKHWVIKGIQKLTLQGEMNLFGDWEVLRDRDVVVGVMGPVKLYSLAEGAWRCIRGDITSARGGQILGIDERNARRSLQRVFANGALQLRGRDPA